MPKLSTDSCPAIGVSSDNGVGLADVVANLCPARGLVGIKFICAGESGTT